MREDYSHNGTFVANYKDRYPRSGWRKKVSIDWSNASSHVVASRHISSPSHRMSRIICELEFFQAGTSSRTVRLFPFSPPRRFFVFGFGFATGRASGVEGGTEQSFGVSP